MKETINRRTFVKKSVLLGSAALIGNCLSPGLFPNESQLLGTTRPVDLSVVKGENFFKSAIQAVQLLGGMEKFVLRGSNVGLLLNSPFKNYGAHTKPEIALAAVKMCYDAGAKEVYLLKEGFDGYWERSKLSVDFQEEIKSLRSGFDDFIDHTIPNAVALNEPSITKILLDCDVFINIPILKHHEGIQFTCALKNMMGTSSTPTNMSMHFGGKIGLSFFPDVDYLAQCIVDLNTIRKPDLCIVDATEFIVEKGPYGPGKLAKPHLVVAGTDRVAVDTYCSKLLGLDSSQLTILKKAANQDLGEGNLETLNIREIAA